jgi:CheY-like chemotaxis protein
LRALTKASKKSQLTAMIREEELNIAPPSANASGEHPCVLLVEDDPALRRYLEVVLQRAGYAVVPAGDGLEAMKFLLTTHVDVVVTDALMPNLDGYELCRFVRSSQQFAHLPIILLSALDPKNSTDESEQVNAFLSKPVSPENLIAAIHRFHRLLD